ncbi:MAG: protein tyrosine phosphatase family protein [Litoreibacter sp.]
MNIHYLTPDFAVAPQITVEDLPAIKDAGFDTVICNRPAMESTPQDQPELIAQAVASSGLAFIDNPLVSGQLSMDHITAQESAASKKTLAYCASGTRSAILWALATAGKMPTDDILEAMSKAGYAMPQLRGQIDMLASPRHPS